MAVYAIQAGENGPVKLGKADDPKRRLGELQVAHWVELRLIRVWEGGEAEETFLHERFAHLHLRGDWHSWSKELLGDVGLVPIQPQEEPAIPQQTVARISTPGPSPCFKLDAWLSDNRMAMAEFGNRIGASHSTVSRLCTGKLRPSMDLMMRIWSVTGGAITPNDFAAIDADAS